MKASKPIWRAALSACVFPGALWLTGCASQDAIAADQHQPLETEDGWVWSKPEVEQRVKNGELSQALANRTLAADGGVCASQAGETPVQTAVCESEYVFECVDLPDAGFSECSSAVRGPDCRDEEIAAITRVQQAAFVNCMIELGWQRQRQPD